jgi:hypothetical protein
MKKLLTTLLALTSLSTFASGITLGDPAFGGNGCPQGTASAVVSPDGKSLSILFDEYMVEAQGKTTTARKSCNIAIPVHVPNGYSVSVIGVDYRGYVSLPAGASARFTAEYFFAGIKGPSFARDFFGSYDDEYTLTNKLGLQALVWSTCGADVNLRINSAMLTRTNAKKELALATVDSVDVNAGLIYHFQFRKCF